MVVAIQKCQQRKSMKHKNWEEQEIDLGSTKGEKLTGVFTREEFSTIEIESISASCGCSVPVYDYVEDTITVTYTPGKVPHHLKEQGFYTTIQYITVLYADGKKDVLSIKAKILDK